MEKDLRKAVHPTYLSIDGILASETKIACVTERVIPKFGHLVPPADDLYLSKEMGSKLGPGCTPFEDLPKGISLNLPVWMAHALWKRKYLSVEMPGLYKDGIFEVLDIDPIIANLKSYHPQFFESGLVALTSYLVMPAGVDDDEMDNDMSEQLLATLKERMLCIADATLPKKYPNSCAKRYASSLPATFKPKAVSRKSLDSLELRVYDESVCRTMAFRKYLEVIGDLVASIPVQGASQEKISKTANIKIKQQESANVATTEIAQIKEESQEKMDSGIIPISHMKMESEM